MTRMVLPPFFFFQLPSSRETSITNVPYFWSFLFSLIKCIFDEEIFFRINLHSGGIFMSYVLFNIKLRSFLNRVFIKKTTITNTLKKFSFNLHFNAMQSIWEGKLIIFPLQLKSASRKTRHMFCLARYAFSQFCSLD